MELKIHKINNRHETFYSDSYIGGVEMPTCTEIEFTLTNEGKQAAIKMKVVESELQRYNSVPDYEATAWEFLRGVLKGLE